MTEVRKASGVTQAELAERIGMAQSDLWTLERRRDARLSTLRAYFAGLGAELRLEIVRDGVRQAIKFGDLGSVDRGSHA